VKADLKKHGRRITRGKKGKTGGSVPEKVHNLLSLPIGEPGSWQKGEKMDTNGARGKSSRRNKVGIIIQKKKQRGGGGGPR